MTRKEAATAHFHPVALQVLRLVCDPRPNRIAIRFGSDELDAEPMILGAHIISHQDWRAVVDSNQDIGSAVVIEISDGQAARRQRLTENRPALLADIA